MPKQLCPPNVQPISDVAISAGYAAYSGAAGSGRVVRQPHGWSSLSFFARHGTQLLIREQRREPDGDPKTLRMAHLPRALLTAMPHRSAAGAAAGASSPSTLSASSSSSSSMVAVAAVAAVTPMATVATVEAVAAVAAVAAVVVVVEEEEEETIKAAGG